MTDGRPAEGRSIPKPVEMERLEALKDGSTTD